MNRKQGKQVAIIVFIAALFLFLLTDHPAAKRVEGFSIGPPEGRTGAPGELTCTTGCHALNQGTGLFTIIAPPVYEVGKTYQIRVQHTTTERSRRRWGFQLTALTGASQRAGNLRSLDNLTTVLNNTGPGSNRQYIEHTAAGTFAGQLRLASWVFEWTAPETDVGPIIFYAAGNQANNDGTSFGDQIYTTLKAVLTGPPAITQAEVSGKKLIVTGENFDLDAELRMNGAKQKKTANEPNHLTTRLVAAKSGKKIARGQTVILQVINPDGTPSAEFSYLRPL